jgi:hypothetical protein
MKLHKQDTNLYGDNLIAEISEFLISFSHNIVYAVLIQYCSKVQLVHKKHIECYKIFPLVFLIITG